jgi:hypothetical protein
VSPISGPAIGPGSGPSSSRRYFLPVPVVPVCIRAPISRAKRCSYTAATEVENIQTYRDNPDHWDPIPEGLGGAQTVPWKKDGTV